MIEDTTTQSEAQSTREQLYEQAYADAKAYDAEDSQPSSAQQDGEAVEVETPRVEPKTADSPTDNPEPSAEKKTEGPARDENGKFIKKDAAPVAEAQVPPLPAKPDTAYSKAVKDQERLVRNRQEFEQEKTQWRQEREQLKREFDQLRTQVASVPRQGPATMDSKQYTSAANEFRKRALKAVSDGDIEGANEQFAYEQQARSAAEEASQTEAQENGRQFQAKWQQDASTLINDVPDLANLQSEAGRQVMGVLDQFPFLRQLHGGFKYAYELGQLQKSAAEVSGLREENAQLKADNERLVGLTTPAGGKDPAKPASVGPKKVTWADAEREALAFDAA